MADFCAVWHRDPNKRRVTPAQQGGQQSVTGSGWLVTVSCLPGAEANELFNPSCGIVICQGADDLIRTPGDWRKVEYDLGEPSGYCASTSADDICAVSLMEGGRARLLQSHAALMPLYVYAPASMVMITSSIDLLLRHVPAQPGIDRATLAMWANGQPLFAENRSMLEGVALLRRGQRSCVDANGVVSSESADREFLGAALSLGELDQAGVAERLRDAVLSVLDRDLVASGVNLLSLSGGVDSSTLATLANRTLRRPIRTLSVLPGQVDVQKRELASAEAGLRGVPRSHRLILPVDFAPFSARKIVQSAPRVAVPVLHPVLCHLSEASQQFGEKIDVYFGGEFCDEIIGGEAVLEEWLADVGFFTAMLKLPIRSQRGMLRRRHALYVASGSVNQMRRWLRRAPDPRLLPQYFNHDVRAEVSTLIERVDSIGVDHPSAIMLNRFLTYYTPILDMNWAVCAASGVRRSFPFANRRVLSLLWRTRPRHRLGPTTKAIFRKAFAGDAPEALARKDKGHWGRSIPFKAPVFDMVDAHDILDSKWATRHNTDNESASQQGLYVAKAVLTSCFAFSGQDAHQTAAHQKH